ncbi:MAG: ribosome maturation factor RimP [Hyphomicrobiaceae bacterium]|nr:ribosome maturation factor RimP [Hyphomicrobiaceae bacterium]
MSDAQSEISQQRFIRETGLALEIAAIVEPALEDLGFRLVRVAMLGRGDRQTLQIMAERSDGTISIDDCETISKQLSPLLDAFDPLPGAYSLEVSSPGIDRPLVRPSDFEDWAGHEAKVELREAIDGRKRFRGVLEGAEGDEVRLEVELDQIGRQVIGLPIALIGEARLVLTDELVRASLRRSKQDTAEGNEADEASNDTAASEN